MPFKSKAQQRWMFAAEERGEVEPGTAERWAKETGERKMAKLPERVERMSEGGSVNPVPPASVRSVARNALERRREHGRGGTEVGVARARDLAAGKGISPSTLKRMKSFFARHSVDPKDDPTSAASIAWALWGGDAGRRWANAQVNKLDRKKKK